MIRLVARRRCQHQHHLHNPDRQQPACRDFQRNPAPAQHQPARRHAQQHKRERDQQVCRAPADARHSSLLRTRIDIALAKQNRDLLTSMDTRTHLQLRLQQTVEGLSVVAISYYAVALVGYLAGPAHAWKDWVMAAAVPVVFTAAWLFARRLRRGLAE